MPKHAYSGDVNKEPEFMDLNKLAEHLARTPTHPITRQPLTAKNIQNYAFRIE